MSRYFQKLKSPLNTILVFTLLFIQPCIHLNAANPDGDLRIEIIAAYNLVVDSNVETPASYGPRSFFIGAKFCNDGTNDLTDVFAYVGNYIDGTNDTPGIYPVETTDEVGLGYSYSGDFSLTHIADLNDATRYVGTVPAGECVTQYWLVEYPTIDANGNAVWGNTRNNEDDLQMSYDVWAVATDGGSSLAAQATRTVTCRNEISAMANKIWPNGDNKVPDAYKQAIEDSLGWDILASTGGYDILPAAGTLSLSGIWYDLGNINQGFDNNGDYVPDYNAWMQPVGDPSLYDPDCFRLTKTYGIVIVKLKTGGEYLIPFEDQLYFENLPENTGAVGLVYYEFIALDGPCTASLSPYQEVASGSNNEKFNGDFGYGQIPLAQSIAPSITLNKSNSPALPSSLPATLTYTLSFSNSSSSVAVGQPEYGLPLVIQDSIPTGTEYIAGSAASGNTLPAGVTSYIILYSTDNKTTWTLTEPATASDVTDIQWWLSDAVAASESGSVTFQVNVPTSFADAMIINTGYVSFGSNDPFDSDTAQAFMPGINSVSGTVYADDGGTTGTEWNEAQDGDESGISSITVTLYYDANGDGTVSAGDFVWGTKTTDGSGNYSFTDLPDGYFVVVVDPIDSDIPSGYVETTNTSTAISLDPTASSGTAVDQTGVDFGFGPAVRINKYLSSGNPVYEGDTISFKLTVSNRSDVPLGTVPVVDTFDADRLEFLYAVPEETSTSTGGTDPYSNTGLINWSNIGNVSGNGASTSGSSSSLSIAAPLVAHWAFEEGSGLTASDSSSSGLDGTLNNGPVWTTGKIGTYAMAFDGLNDYIQSPTANPGLGNSFAFSFWAKVDNMKFTYFVSNASAANGVPGAANEYGIWITNTGSLYFNWFDTGSNSHGMGHNMTTGQWEHIVLNYDGSNLSTYINGSLVSSTAYSINLADISQAIILGMRADNNSYLEGSMDDVRIYQDALTTSEISALASYNPTGTYPTLSHHWAFEEGSGTSTVDSTGGLTAMLTNGPTWTSGMVGSGAIDFDATNDYLVTGASNPGLGTTFAISTWVNIDATGTYYIVTNSDNDSPLDAGEYGFLLSAGAPFFAWGNGATQTQSSGYTLSANTWHHLVINYDGSNLNFYVDGTLRNSSTQTINLTDIGQNIQIGRKISANYFGGTMDELRIYQDHLSEAQISDLYTSAFSCSPSQLALWDFEEGSGTTTADGSGNGLDLTLTNGPVWSTGQVGSSALTFDGTDDYVIKTNTNISLGNSFSIAFWASTNDLAGGNTAYVSNSDPGATVEGEWFVASQSTTGLSFVYNPSDGNQTTIGSNYTLDDGLWHHIVVNYDGLNITFYVDGTNVYSQTASLNISATATLNLILGNNTTTPGNNLDGSLDQVVIYDCALSTAEISRLIETATIEILSGQEVTVVFKTKSQTVAVDTTTNYATVTGATFVDGRPANDDTDQATAIILNTGSISGYIWNDEDGLGWEGASGLDANDDSLVNVRVVLHECQTSRRRR